MPEVFVPTGLVSNAWMKRNVMPIIVKLASIRPVSQNASPERHVTAMGYVKALVLPDRPLVRMTAALGVAAAVKLAASIKYAVHR